MPEEYTDATYGDRIADIYDVRYLESLAGDTADAVSFLKALAGDGPALELGIGTGRVAIPLAEAGVDVHGLDASEAMAAKLRSKPHGDGIHVTIGSFADFSLETRFPLVYVVFNTFFSLLTQDEQVSSFASVARHLTPERCLRDAGLRARRHEVREPATASGRRVGGHRRDHARDVEP